MLISLTLAACADREDDFTPLLEPLPPEIQQWAAAGDTAARFALAEYHRGDDDPTVMLRWLRESARRGDPTAQVSLGVLYDAGDGVPQDRFEAYLWFARAAAQGDLEGRRMADERRTTLTEVERAWTVEPPDLADAPDCVQWRK